MAKITYHSTSPKGGAELDTARLVVGTDGRAWLRSGEALVPLTAEQTGVVAAHFGATWRDAVDAVKALAG